jgi:hypothetical protein
MVHL